MAFSYPEFHGGADEDIFTFLEQMEIAWISNHIVEPASMLRLLQICLKGNACTWLKEFEAQQATAQPPQIITVEGLKDALKHKYEQVEDADKIWHLIGDLKQGEAESVECFVKKFVKMWDQLCKALEPERPPTMLKKDSFIAGLNSTLRWKVELKKPISYEDAVEKAKGREWKNQRMTQLGMGLSIIRPVEVKRWEAVPTVNRETVLAATESQSVQPSLPSVTPSAPPSGETEELRRDMQQVVDLMKNMSLNLMNSTGGKGRGKQYYAPSEGPPTGGSGGKGYYSRRRLPTCFKCGELGHYSTECDRPPRAGGDMFPLPSQLPDRSKDYAVDIREDPGPSSRFTAEEKGKGKAVNVITLEKTKKRETNVMPIGKRTTDKRDNRGIPGPSKKKGKMKEGDNATTKKKRRPRRHFQVSDFPMGVGQTSYSLKDDIVDRKANITFGKILELALKLWRQWKSLANPTEKEPKKGSVTLSCQLKT